MATQASTHRFHACPSCTLRACSMRFAGLLAEDKPLQDTSNKYSHIQIVSAAARLFLEFLPIWFNSVVRPPSRNWLTSHMFSVVRLWIWLFDVCMLFSLATQTSSSHRFRFSAFGKPRKCSGLILFLPKHPPRKIHTNTTTSNKVCWCNCFAIIAICFFFQLFHM